MEKKLKKFFIITNASRDRGLLITKRLIAYLSGRGMEAKYHATDTLSNGVYTDASMIPGDVECVIVLGGDGTLIAASRDTASLGLPLLGINAGTLGYLADVEIENAETAIDLMMNGEYEIEERMMLKGSVFHENGECFAQSEALNDVVLRMSSLIKAAEFDLIVNDKRLASFKSDGMIICTPTGSTAYSMSAGGPIVDPMARMMVITPICPHNLNHRSIVLSAHDVVKVVVHDPNTVCVFDGHGEVGMKSGEYVAIERSCHVTRIIRTTKGSFLSVLSNKFSGE